MHKGERDDRYVVLLFTTACAHWRRVVGHASGCGSGCGSGRQYTVICTLVCIHSAGGWSLLLTASRTTPPSLSSWGAEHNENPPTTSTPGIDTSNHCPAWKETAGLETFNSNHFTVGESCFTPTTVACDVTYVRTYGTTGRKQAVIDSVAQSTGCISGAKSHWKMWRLRAWDLCASDVLSRWLLPRALFVKFAMQQETAASSLRLIGCSIDPPASR